ncbi:MAG: hypothetical protein PVH61_38100 [Candidatus Aminicenantes bacterium]|jgi:hypothetical protein
MKHIEIEDIGRLIDGNVSKKEQKQFLEHMSQCKTCLTLYNETLKFMGEDQKSKTTLKLPAFEEITSRIKHVFESIFAVRKYRWAAAISIIILVTAAFLWQVFSGGGIGKIEQAQIQHIENRVENLEIKAIFPSRDKIYEAVRAGIFVEELSLLVRTNAPGELRIKILQILMAEIDRLTGDRNTIVKELTLLDKKNLEKMVRDIRELMEEYSLTELFQLGGFLEQSIFSTFESKTPLQEDIERYQQIARTYKLPPGVFKRLERLKKADDILEIRNLLKEIEQVFFE